MGYNESFDNNIANEQSIEASFDDTYQGQNTVSGDESEGNFHEHLDGDEGDYEGDMLEEQYSPQDDDMDMDMDDDGEGVDNDYEQAVAAGSAVAAGAPHSVLGTANMAYEDIEHEDSLTLDVEGDRGVEVHEGIEMEDYHDEEETLEENTMDENTYNTYGEEETYDVREVEDMMVHDSKPGDINCWCVPTRVKGCGNFFARTVAWTKLNKCELIGGITVSMAQIPETISAALIAGVSPTLALQSTWAMNLIATLVGGSPGLITGASGTVAIALMNLVKNHGVSYIWPAIILAGIIQIVFGILGFGAVVRLVPYPVLTGFANAMALLIVALQLRFWRVSADDAFAGDGRKLIVTGHSWQHFADGSTEWADLSTSVVMLIEAVVSLIICFALPRVTKIVPSAFVAILFGLIMNIALVKNIGYSSFTVQDYGSAEIVDLYTMFSSEHRVPINFETLEKIYLTSIAVFGVSLIETLMSSNILDELSGQRAQRNRVSLGVGAGNVVSGLIGGMGGSASTGMTILANLSNANTRLSSFVASIFFVLIVYAAPVLVNHIPLATIAGVMFYVAIKLFRWRSIVQLVAALLPLRARETLHLDCKVSRSDIFTMLVVMAISLVFDFAIAVLVGVVMAVFIFVWDSSNRIVIEKEVIEEEGTVTYNISGPIFFATAQGFIDIFETEDFEGDPEEVVIMLEGANVYDWSGMKALKTVHDRLADLGKVVALASISPSSRQLMEKNANMWAGVSFLEVEEIDEEMTTGYSTVKPASTMGDSKTEYD